MENDQPGPAGRPLGATVTGVAKIAVVFAEAPAKLDALTMYQYVTPLANPVSSKFGTEGEPTAANPDAEEVDRYTW